jgi:hypothetical protein
MIKAAKMVAPLIVGAMALTVVSSGDASATIGQGLPSPHFAPAGDVTPVLWCDQSGCHGGWGWWWGTGPGPEVAWGPGWARGPGWDWAPGWGWGHGQRCYHGHMHPRACGW